MKDLLGGIWGLFLLACLAMFMGWIDVPKPLLALMDNISGNREDAFTDVVKFAPANQLQFARIVNDTTKAYHEAPNDMAKGGLRSKRKDALCGINKGSTDGEWVGLIAELSTNGDGDGVLAIRIAPHLVVKTWNNALSDIGNNTLLKPSDPVHSAAVALKEGDIVQFSGTFFEDDTDCIDEASLTLDGSMSDPEFIIRFASLRRFTR